MSGDIFAALGDPTRRHLYGRLVDSGPATATRLAAELAISRQAVAKHLGILADAGMAASERAGRETWFEARLEPLGEIERWVHEIEGHWARRLGALAAALRDEAEAGESP